MEVAVEVAILIGVALPFVRLALCRPFLRRLAGAPEPAIIGFSLLVGYLVGVVAVALIAPALLRPMAIAAVVVGAFAIWRARPSFGVAGGLPPGVLRIAPVGPWVDPDYFARDARRFGPVFKSTTFVAPTLCIVGLPAALDLFEHHESALKAPTNRFSRFIPRGFLRYMTDEDHATYAPVLRSAVSTAVTRVVEAELAEIVRTHLAAAAAAGGTVRVSDLTRQIVLRMFLRLFFGIGRTDPELPRLESLYRRIDQMRAWRVLPRQIQVAVDEIAQKMAKREVTQSYLAAARAAHGDAVDDATAMKNLVYMCQTGAADTAALLTWAVWMLSTNPEWVERLRGSDDPGAARRVVQETLRLEQSEYILRRVTREIRWRGYVVPRGWRVRVCVRESHRDPQVFTEPDRFHPDRFAGEPIPRTRYSAFGMATTRTSCLGPHVTLTVGRIFVQELVHGFDWTVANGSKVEFSGVHWSPSSRFAIGLTAVQAPAQRAQITTPLRHQNT